MFAILISSEVRQMFTIKEAHAAITKVGVVVSLPTVYAWLKRGEIPCVRVGKIIRVRESDLENFLSKLTGASNPFALNPAK